MISSAADMARTTSIPPERKRLLGGDGAVAAMDLERITEVDSGANEEKPLPQRAQSGTEG
jgi:hypothetical protein